MHLAKDQQDPFGVGTTPPLRHDRQAAARLTDHQPSGSLLGSGVGSGSAVGSGVGGGFGRRRRVWDRVIGPCRRRKTRDQGCQADS